MASIHAGCREYLHEKSCEYRGTVMAYRPMRELDVCNHRHRSREAALQCAKRMIRQWERRATGKPLIEIL